MPNVNRRGFFIKPNGDLSLTTEFPNCPVPWSKEFIVKVETLDPQRLLSIYGGNLELISGTQLRARDSRGAQSQVSASYPTNGTAFQVGYRGFDNGGAPAHWFTRNGSDIGTAQNAVDDARGWNVPQLLAPEYTSTYLSWLEFVNNDGLTATYDANLVPNAAGDGWVSRLQADYGNVAAASGYESVLYDTEQLNSPYNASSDGTAEWIYDADFNEDIGTVRASQSGLVVNFDPNFEPVSARIGTLSVTINSQASGTATLSFPDMATALNWSKFGNRTLALTDSLGNEVSQTVMWLPATGYEYRNLTGANTTDQASIFYNWGVAGTDYEDAVPPVDGDQIVYDTTYYSNISTTGIITIADGAPASFTSEAYLIDDDGMQAFNTDSGQGEPAGNPPTATIETAAQTVEAGATLQLAATVTDADSIAWTTSGSGSFTDATVEDAEFIAGSGGEVETLTLSATNTDGTTTATVDITVNAAVTDSTLNATITNIPDGTYDTRILSDSGDVLFFGSKAWAGESASFTLTDVPAGTDVEYYVIGATEGGIDRGVTE